MEIEVHRDNFINIICTTPMLWNYEEFTPYEDEHSQVFTGSIPERDLQATVVREEMYASGMWSYFLEIRKGSMLVAALSGVEAERIFFALELQRSKHSSGASFSSGVTFPAANDTTSGLLKFAICMKHLEFTFKSAELIEELYIAAQEAPIGISGSWKQTRQTIRDGQFGGLVDITSYEIIFNGMKIQVSESLPKLSNGIEDLDGRSDILEDTYILRAHNPKGELITCEVDSRARRIFELLENRFRAESSRRQAA